MQQALLRMMEGSIVSVSAKGNPNEVSGSVGSEGRPRGRNSHSARERFVSAI